MTEVMAECSAPREGPGGASIAKARCAKAATPQGCDSRADSRMQARLPVKCIEARCNVVGSRSIFIH